MNKARREVLTRICNSLEGLQEAVSAVRDEEDDAMENMPENMQSSDRHDDMEKAVDVLEEANDLFDELMDKLQEIDGVG